MGLLDRFKLLAIDDEGGQLHGQKTKAIGIGHNDAQWFSADFYDDWLMGLGPVETAFLHGWILHLRIARTMGESSWSLHHLPAMLGFYRKSETKA